MEPDPDSNQNDVEMVMPVAENVVVTTSSTARRGSTKRKKTSKAAVLKRRAAFGKKCATKLLALKETLKPVPFTPILNKNLDFNRHESLLKRLGLWDFVHLEFDPLVRTDLVAELIANYNPALRYSYVKGVRILVNRADLARALRIPWKKEKAVGASDGEGRVEKESEDSIKVVEEIVSNWMFLHGDTWCLPEDVVNMIRPIREGNLEKMDWAGLIWYMMEKELSAAPKLENCYYATYMQCLIKTQKEKLLKEEVKVDLEEEDCDGDVSLGDRSVDTEGNIVQLSGEEDNAVDLKEGVENESIEKEVKEEKMRDEVAVEEDKEEKIEDEGADEGDKEEKVGDEGSEEKERVGDEGAEKEERVGDEVAEEEERVGDEVAEEEERVGDEVAEEEERVGDEVAEKEQKVGDEGEGIGQKVGDEGAGIEPKLGDVGAEMEQRLEDVDAEMEQKLGDDNVREEADDHLGNEEQDNVDKKETENIRKEEMDKVGNEFVKCDVENEQKEVSIMEEEMIKFDGAENEEGTGQLFDGSRSGVKEQFLKRCDLGDFDMDFEDHKQTQNLEVEDEGQGEGEDEENEDEDDEDDEPDQDGSFLLSMGGEALEGSGNLVQGMGADHQFPFSSGLQICGNELTTDFLGSKDDNGAIPGGSHFGQSNKRVMDHDDEVPHNSLNGSSKRIRLGGAWENKSSSDFDTCLDQSQHWMQKAKIMYMEKEQLCNELSSNQQLLLNELQKQETTIQHLHKVKLEEQQRIQKEIYRLNRELYLMTDVLDGYRKALKSTRDAFAEYRARFPQFEEPLYGDVPGGGGLMLTCAEIEKQRLIQEEEERMSRILIENKIKDFEAESLAKFEAHRCAVESLNDRLLNVEKQIEPLRDLLAKRKVPDLLECPAPTQ